MLKPSDARWTTSDAEELYEVPRWGKGYFSVRDDGRLLVHPDKNPATSIDLKKLVDDLQSQGVQLPILVRFSDILRTRIQEITGAFAKAIKDHDYKGDYTCVYPIKVNQQRQVVDEILEYGKPLGVGLEAGSKPELLAVLALAGDDTPIICNGFKDDEFIETALLAKKSGAKIIPVVEKYSELMMIIRYAEKIGVRPDIGMRIKLASRGSGRWQASGGYYSKFGLTVSEMVKAFNELKSRGMEDCFKLLHFHLGSQITNIRRVKDALVEAARVYVEFSQRGAGLEFLDIGGGLGVDYDGSQTNFESSMNYTLDEYAADVVHHLHTVCDDANVPHPRIVSECGRALVAYNSVLVFGVLGVIDVIGDPPVGEVPEKAEQTVHDLAYTHRHVNARNLLESHHDAQQLLETALTLFSTGHLTLDERDMAERFYWSICRKIRSMVDSLDFVPEELQGLDRRLAQIYFCNFSLFQSMPDSWAINQLFPIMPIHRLQKQPTNHAILADITCDSDGKIDQFIDRRDVKRTLRLHEFDGSPYLLGTFLLGAYQEILGDLHNLFGDTHAVHVKLNDKGETVIKEIIRGDTVKEVLHYVQFDADELLRKFTASVNRAVGAGRLSQTEADEMLLYFNEGLSGYTYLEEPTEG
ncbi:biosynthetic arginine decarboxylase [Lignipirellula cremea]|uniref:Biosynthetic arginine decarboxylase n=1 Tax=Lignipirellula cremea TaxID=2528010 RepID=A0A518DQ24_9BACT|nr:biosynthetic arginine decarboxylase [Lignipirellula cremea]QDU93940.1 Biosynthetic arginine decarboxylase [Lignipirellula cremea]